MLSKYFGPKPELRGPISRLTAVGEEKSVKSVGVAVGHASIRGIPLEDLNLVVMPISMKMSTPLILGMDFIRRKKLKINPGDWILS